MHLDATCDLVLVSRTLRSLHYFSCGWVGGWVGVDTEINAKPAQAEAGVGAGAELGKNTNFMMICCIHLGDRLA